MDKFKTPDGLCTLYALCCGYIDLHEENGYRLTHWREHGVSHVRLTAPDARRLFWHSWESEAQASACYVAAKDLCQTVEYPCLDDLFVVTIPNARVLQIASTPSQARLLAWIRYPDVAPHEITIERI